jgi:diguanylate cyclase
MKYLHNKAESTEHLRRALPMMSSQDAGLHPVSYAVWYEHVSGMNAQLSDALGKLLAQKDKLDERDVVMLFERYVADVGDESASTFAAGFQRILGEISQSTGVASQEAGVFNETLLRMSQGDALQNPENFAQLLADTQSMQASVATLNNRLEASQSEIETLRAEITRAREASLTDGLTGLVNRKGFDQALADCLACTSSDAPDGPCLLMCDIDHFKKVNDTYGHVFGDKVIRAVASVIKQNVKGRDTAARYGGEEFVVLLPETSLQGAQTLAEQIRSAIERGRIKRGDQDADVARITLSLGVARHLPGETPSGFVERADRALYASKQNGRNRVSLAPTQNE